MMAILLDMVFADAASGLVHILKILVSAFCFVVYLYK